MTGREIVLSALRGETPPRLPVMPITMMLAGDQVRQPYGRYALDHRIMAEGQLVTAERFGFDYVSGISDPGREAHDFGARICLFEDQPPAADEENALLQDKAVLGRLRLPDPTAGRMGDRVSGVALMKQRAAGQVAVEGWVEGPCAEGADLRGINTLMLDFYDDPRFVRDLFELVTANAIAFARAQIDAGADLIGVGDAAASLVGPAIYGEFVLPCERRIVEAIHAAGSFVRLHICGNIADLLPAIATLGVDLLDLDSMVPVERARAATGPRQLLLGNLDPVRVVQDGTPTQVRAALAACHFAAGPRYVAGAGCELPRHSPPANVRVFGEYARGSAP
jgi:MtaA/CmuA family methyltransferase